MQTNFRCLLRFALAMATLLIATPALAQNSPNSEAPLRDGSHDFDFALGKWRTEVSMIKDPFNKPNEVVHMKGTKVGVPVWNGKAILEEIEADGPGGHWQAANLFLYDPVAHQWSQNYADSATGRMDAVSEIGGYRNGNLEFYWQDSIGGRAMLLRGIWKDFTPNSHTYEVSRSIDGGRTWHTSFIAHVTRAL